MPPLPPVPQVLKVIIQGNSGESTPLTWQNVLHLSYSGSAPSGSVCNALALHVATEWGTHMSPEQVSNCIQNEVTVTDLTSATSGSGADFTSNTGSRGSDEIPANVAFLINYNITRRYRGGRPRTYLIVGGNADFLDAAHWSTAFTAEVGTHWTAFLNAVIGYSSGGTTLDNLVNVSYYDKALNPVPPYRRTTPVVDPIVIADLIAEQQMASQRRRIGRRRR